MERTLLYVFIISGFLILSSKCNAQNSLILKFHDGTESVTLLSSLSKITFSGNDIVFTKTDASSFNYPIENVGNITFGFFSQLPKVVDCKSKLSVFPNPATNYIELNNYPEGELNIQIISSDGIVVMNKKNISGSDFLDISNFKNQLYIMNVNKSSTKFIKQ